MVSESLKLTCNLLTVGAFFSKTTRRICANFFSGFRRKHLFIITCIEHSRMGWAAVALPISFTLLSLLLTSKNGAKRGLLRKENYYYSLQISLVGPRESSSPADVQRAYKFRFRAPKFILMFQKCHVHRTAILNLNKERIYLSSCHAVLD